MTMFYTGNGARDTKPEILQTMRRIAQGGWILRSGAARGADSAFERAAAVALKVWPREICSVARYVAAPPHILKKLTPPDLLPPAREHNSKALDPSLRKVNTKQHHTTSTIERRDN